jgi:ribosomal protein S8E
MHLQVKNSLKNNHNHTYKQDNVISAGWIFEVDSHSNKINYYYIFKTWFY